MNGIGSKRILGVSDIVFMNVIAILSLRQIPNAAPYGAASVVLWIFSAFLFFLPLAMVCGELSTGWPKDGGIFVWVREAFGDKSGWFIVVCYIFSCVLFFPLMLQFAFTAIGFIFSVSLSQNKVFVGLSSIVMFWLLTYFNIKGMWWTKVINKYSAIIGVYIPGILMLLMALVWLFSGHQMQTSYTKVANWIPNFGDWSTLTFTSTMMFAFAGFEIAPMIAGHTRNPQKNFPRAILISAIVIGGIYIIGTCSLNVMFPASDDNIISGIMQAFSFASAELQMPWLLPVIGICIAVGAIGQSNAWLVGPMYMLRESIKEKNLLGQRMSSLHPQYNTPAFALIVQAVLVSFFCFSTFVSPSMEAAYWMLTALTTICYFIPYVFMFAAYYRLRITRPDVYRSFRIRGKIMPIVFPALGMLSVIFAIILLFIPPKQINMGGYFLYVGKLVFGVGAAVVFAFYVYGRAERKVKFKK